MLQTADLFLLRYCRNMTLFGSENLSHIAPNVQHKVAIISFDFFGIID